MTRKMIFECPNIMEHIRRQFGEARKYKATAHPTPSSISTFSMIFANITSARITFDALRARQAVFNCINNDIVSKDPDYFASDEFKTIISMWQNLYETLFPIRSQYELSHGIRNGFRYVNEYRLWKVALASNESLHLPLASDTNDSSSGNTSLLCKMSVGKI